MAQPEMNYDVSASPVIGKFLANRKYAVEGLMGPFGSGKSVAVLMKLVMLTSEMPPMPDGIRRARWAVVRNTYGQLQDTTIRTVHTWLPETKWGEYTKSDHLYRVTEFEGLEIEFMFRALDRPDHVNNLLSLEVTGSWVNEAREVPREIIGPLFGRGGRWPPRAMVGSYQRRMLMDTNPPDVDSWWYEDFEEKRRRGWHLYRQPGGRTPQAENLPFLDPDYYRDMADVMTDDEIRVYVDAEYGYLQTGKSVYPEYNDSFHCREFEVDSTVPVIRGWDFGLTPACVWMQLMPNGQLRIFDEMCAERAGITAFAPVVLTHHQNNWSWASYAHARLRDVGDPAGKTPGENDERSCFDIMEAMGIMIEAGNQSPTLRQESMRFPLMQALDGQPGLLIHPRCKVMRKGFQGEYKYRRLLVGGLTPRYAQVPDKNKFSHPHDAAQYVAVEYFGDRVTGRELQPGDYRQEMAESYIEPLEHNLGHFEAAQQQEYADSDFDPYNLGR